MTIPTSPVTDLPPGGAALVNYTEYRTKHPLPLDSRDNARLSPDARIFTLPEVGAALVKYSKYDGFVLPRKES